MFTFFFYSNVIKKQCISVGLPAEKSFYFPFGVYDHKLGDYSHQENDHKYKPGEPNFLFFGTLRPEKGIGMLVEVINRLGPGINFTIAGKKRDWDGHLDLNGLVTPQWRPYVQIHERSIDEEEKDLFFRTTDFILMPYLDKHANSSAIFFETAQHVKPIIASCIGDRAKYIEDYKMGYLFEPGDIDGFQNAIRKAIKCTEKEYRAMKDGVKKFAQDYSLNKVIKKSWIPQMLNQGNSQS
jgi:glycosyltransferase involved in cell wall biosynthesis